MTVPDVLLRQPHRIYIYAVYDGSTGGDILEELLEYLFVGDDLTNLYATGSPDVTQKLFLKDGDVYFLQSDDGGDLFTKTEIGGYRVQLPTFYIDVIPRTKPEGEIVWQ